MIYGLSRSNNCRQLMNFYRIAAYLLITVSVSACAPSSSDASLLPETAKGETPIRHVICSAHGGSCFVNARFDDFDSCERYKKWSGMLCDSQSNPGQIVCRPGDDSIAKAYCTK